MDKNSLNTMLHDYLQGKLSPAEIKHIEKILKEKPELNKDLKNIRDYYNTLSMLDPVKAPDDFLDKVHSKISTKSSLLSKIFSPKWLSAEVAGLALSIGLVILIVNPFNFKEAPIIEYDEVPKPDLREYSVSGDERAYSKDPEKTLDEEIRAENQIVKKSNKQVKRSKATKAKPKRIDSFSAGAGLTAEITSEKPSAPLVSNQIVQEELNEENVAEKEYLSEPEEVSASIKRQQLIESATPAIVEGAKVIVATTTSSEDEVKQPKSEIERDRKKKDRKSNKIGSYLEPREEKLRELKKKIEELHESRNEQKEMKTKSSSAPMSSNKYYERQAADFDMQEQTDNIEEELQLLDDTVEKVASTKDISNDDITFMIRSNLNKFKNTVLVIDRNEKIFIITMQKDDYKTFEKWLKVKFDNSFKIKDKDFEDKVVSFKLIFE